MRNIIKSFLNIFKSTELSVYEKSKNRQLLLIKKGWCHNKTYSN